MTRKLTLGEQAIDIITKMKNGEKVVLFEDTISMIIVKDSHRNPLYTNTAAYDIYTILGREKYNYRIEIPMDVVNKYRDGMLTQEIYRALTEMISKPPMEHVDPYNWSEANRKVRELTDNLSILNTRYFNLINNISKLSWKNIAKFVWLKFRKKEKLIINWETGKSQ